MPNTNLLSSSNPQSPFSVLLDLDENIASNWDLYLITILTVLLGAALYFRRPPGPGAVNNQPNPNRQQRPAAEIPLLETPPPAATEGRQPQAQQREDAPQ